MAKKNQANKMRDLIKKIVQRYQRRRYRSVIADGERILGLETDDNAQCHKNRYLFASKYLKKGDSVLDFACGSGYGSLILAESGSSVTVVGYDIDEKAIEFGRTQYQRENMELTTDSPRKNFDVVIAFEYLEHVDDIQGAYDDLTRRAGRLVIASVPYHEKEGNNPHHKHFGLDESSLNFGDKVEFFYQNPEGDILGEGRSRQNMIVVREV
ncbi:hypothetical protein CL652_01325 [bacterium]|nr:hypothetical protein [bacterium]|tara:strand:+ start:2731 stop:3363 length:633 start_codon:yes stop_codon:yes gene_type:complete